MFTFEYADGHKTTSHQWRTLIADAIVQLAEGQAVIRIRWTDGVQRTHVFTDPIVNHAKHCSVDLPAGTTHETHVFEFQDGRLFFVDDDGTTETRRNPGPTKHRSAPPFEPHMPVPARPLKLE